MDSPRFLLCPPLSLFVFSCVALPCFIFISFSFSFFCVCLFCSNYVSADALASFARAGVGVCVLFEFPLLERPFRTTLVCDVLRRPDLLGEPWVVLASVAGITVGG
jgi:hypothetical protein